MLWTKTPICRREKELSFIYDHAIHLSNTTTWPPLHVCCQFGSNQLKKINLHKCILFQGFSVWMNERVRLYMIMATSHTRDWEPMTITLPALSLAENAEPVQVRFALHSRNQWSMWMQDGCTVYMDFYITIEWMTFHDHLNYVQKPPLESRPNTKPGDHGT